MVLGGMVYTVVPFYKRVLMVEGMFVHIPTSVYCKEQMVTRGHRA
jgi:hypothetical protein